MGLRVNSNRLFGFILFLLILVFSGLLYAYSVLVRPAVEVVSSPHMELLFGIYAFGNRPDQFLDRPSDVAFDSSGRIYVADTGRSRVLVFDDRGRFIRKIGRARDRKGWLKLPMGITVSEKGRIYVADQDRDAIVVFSPNGRVLREIKVESPIKPLAHDGRLYVSTSSGVVVFNLRSGRRLFRFGRPGNGEGEFSIAAGLAVGSGGDIFVSDLNNLRIQAFNKSGDFQWTAGKPPSDLMARGRRFGLPAGLSVDDDGLLYVVDAFHHQIEVLTDTGDSLLSLSAKGQKEGELYYPQGIAYWKDRIFAVADKHNDRIQVFKIDLPPAGD